MLIQQANAVALNSLQLDASGSLWDFKGHRGINAADPVNAQDVATKNWIGLYIDGVSGLINTTNGIAYDAGSLFDYLRFGVTRNVDTIADLKALSMSRNQRAKVLGYYARGDGGGGPDRYAVTGQPAGTFVENGYSVILPSGGDGSAAWLWAYSGPINLKWCGGNTNAAVDNAPIILKVVQNGVDLVIPRGDTFSVSGVMITGKSNFTVSGGGKLRLMNASNKPVLGATSCTSFKFKGNLIDGNKANQTELVQRNNGACLFAYLCADYEISDNVADNGYSGAVIVCVDNAADPTVLKTNGRVNNNTLTNGGVAGGALLCDGIFCNSDNTEIVGNTIDGMTDYGIAGDYSRNLFISRNNIRNVAFVHIGVVGGKTWKISENILDGAGGGIFVTLSGNPATAPYVSDDILIESNQISNVVAQNGVAGDGIFIDPSATNIKIRDNGVRNGTRGIAAPGPAVSVTDNDVTDMTGRGLFVSGAGSFISGNKTLRVTGGNYYGDVISDKTLIEESPTSGINAPALLNNWVSYGAPYDAAGYFRQGGEVRLRGVVKDGNTGGAPIFILPLGYRPKSTERWVIPGSSAAVTCLITIDTSGNVIHVSGAVTEVHLKNISFVVA